MYNFLPHYLTAFSAILLALSSPLWDNGFLVWGAFIPFLFLLNSKQKYSYKSILLQSFYFQMFFSFLIFFWVVPSFQKLWPDSSFLVNTGTFLFLITLVELQIVVWALIRRRFKFNNFLVTALASAALYTFLDLMAFKFVQDTLAHALYDHYSIKQLVPYIGVYGLTFLIMMINELLYSSLINKSKSGLIGSIVMIGLLYVPGAVILYQNPIDKISNKTKEIMVIQPNFPYNDPLKQSLGREKYRLHISQSMVNMLSEQISKNPEVKTIMLPETVYPIYYFSPENFQEEEINLSIKSLVLNHHLDLFFGGYRRSGNLNTNVYIHLYVQDGVLKEDYTMKVKLFPFGEEIPFAKMFPFLNEFFPTPSVALKGVEPGEGRLSSGEKYGVAICYETITPEIIKSFKGKDLEFILNPSNETVFTSFGEPQMALALSSFRALEAQKPLIRSAATGISALIDKYGRIIEPTKMDEFAIKIYKFNLE